MHIEFKISRSSSACPSEHLVNATATISNATIRTVCRNGLLVIALLMPMATLLPLHTYRAIEALTCIICALTWTTQDKNEFSPLIKWSFWVGLAGWGMSTIASRDRLTSFDVGLLEFLGFFAFFYLSSTYLRERRYFLTAILLFIGGFLIQSAYQAWFVITPVWADGRFKSLIPVFAADLIHYKNGVAFFFPGGIPNTYGNIGNYGSLWTLVVPVIMSFLYTRILPRFIVWPIIILSLWFGLIVYSRSALLSVVAAIIAIWVYRAIVMRSYSPALIAVMVVLIGIHLNGPEGIAQYYGGSVTDFFQRSLGRSETIDASAKAINASKNAITASAEALDVSTKALEVVSSPPIPSVKVQDETAKATGPTVNTVEISSKVVDATAKVVDVSNELLNASNKLVEASKQALDASGNTVDLSGDLRAGALKKALEIVRSSFPFGIGYGMYPAVEPVLTSPHNIALQRLAESGLLGLISFLLLTVYAPLILIGMLKRKVSDMLEIVCPIATIAFTLKAIAFGAQFAISSNMVWALGLALCLTTRQPEAV
jgi:hypothetical protein